MKRVGKLGRRAALLAAALLCLLAPRAAAQFDGVIRGQILDVNGKPWPNLGVQAVSEQGAKSDTKTDDKGNFIIRNLKSGIYTINLQLPNQQPYQVQLRVQTGQETLANVNFKDVAAKQGAEYSEALKKQEEEKEKIEGMRTHFNAGKTLLDQLNQVKGELQKAPGAQRDALRQKLADLSNQAVTEFQAAQKAAGGKDPNLHLIWANLGAAYDVAGRNEEAIDAYQQAIAAKPEAAGYFNNLGNVLARVGKVDDARAAYLKSIELDPASAATAWRNFGIVLYNANRLPDAVEPFQKAVQLDPKNAQAWYLLGASLVSRMTSKQTGDKLEVVLAPGTVEAYEKALELDPNGVYGQQAKQGLNDLQLIAPGIQTKFTTKKKKS